MIPKNDVGIYIVKEHDTLNDVSRKTGNSVENLIKNNEELYLYPEQALFFKKRKTS